jgi:hypothetical protein
MNNVTGRARRAGPDDPSQRPALLRLWDQRAAFKPFAIAGATAVVAGGALAAAIAAPSPTRHGVWAVAYLVLVLGVGQLVLGAGQAVLAADPLTPGLAAATAAAFNVSGVVIVLGVVTDRIVAFDVGAALLLVVLAWLFYVVRRSARAGWTLLAYRLFIAALIVSIPIGMLITTAGRG